MRRLLITLTLGLALGSACSGEHRPARARYNEGVAALGASKFEDAEKAFVESIGAAGVDPELRFNAAFDLGLAYAQHAKQLESAQPPDADQALTLLHQAAAWFQDANRALPDADARANLAIVLARAQALADRVNKGQNGLEPRLMRLIDAQRGVRDQAQAVWDAAAGAAADPTAQRDTYEALATTERTLLAEAGTIADMAGDEVSAINTKSDDQRSDEDKGRLVQLQNLDLYLQEARTALADSQRQLHGVKGESARRSAELALENLKRAREQLQDPIAVLQVLMQEQGALAQVVEDRERRELALRAVPAGAAEADAGTRAASTIPASLAPKVLGEHQAALLARSGEVVARLRAGLSHDEPTPTSAPADPKAAARAKLMAKVAAAMPALDRAVAAMTEARDALVGESIAAARTAQETALLALLAALEQFVELRQLIDLAWSDQGLVVQLLDDSAAHRKLAPDVAAKRVGESIARNTDRLTRMAGLLVEEGEKLAVEAAQAGAAAGGNPAPTDPNGEQKLAAAKQQLERAEELRAAAHAAVAETAHRLATPGADPRPPAKEAHAKLTELRKLFFSVIEHLQELVRDQGETRDQTATARPLDDDARAPLLPGLATRQAEHQAMAQAIAEALAAQADQAAGAGGATGAQGAQGGPDPKALAEATQEVRAAQPLLQQAADTLGKAQAQLNQQSYDLQPVLDDQGQALEHLENALRLLQPPKKDPNQNQDQKQDQQQQQQQQQQKDDASAQEAQRRAQETRDREAQRQRDRQNRQRSQPEPVDKDW